MTSGAYYNEIDPYAAQWLKNLIAANLIAPGEVDTRSIEDVTPNELRGFTQCHFFAGIGVWSHALRCAGWPEDRPVWTGSCPCQPFSAAGKGAGFADERHLWPAWFHLIEQCRPRVVFGEQVASKDGLAWLDLVQTDLEATGYAVGSSDLCAAGVGAPHIRQRLYFVADGHSQRVDGRRSNRTSRRNESPNSGSAGELADDDGQRCKGVGLHLQSRQARQRVSEAQRCGEAGELVDANNARLEGRSLSASGRADQCTAWTPSDFVWCRDGKWRPIEPGTFPLAHGTPARVGRLRAYGNAIVAPLAEAFIRSYLDVNEKTRLADGS